MTGFDARFGETEIPMTAKTMVPQQLEYRCYWALRQARLNTTADLEAQ